MSRFNYCPYPERCPNQRGGFLFPFVGGLLIGGLAAPYFIRPNVPQQPMPYNYSGYYPYGQGGYYPTYTQGNYSYPYANGFYHY